MRFWCVFDDICNISQMRNAQRYENAFRSTWTLRMRCSSILNPINFKLILINLKFWYLNTSHIAYCIATDLNTWCFIYNVICTLKDISWMKLDTISFRGVVGYQTVTPAWNESTFGLLWWHSKYILIRIKAWPGSDIICERFSTKHIQIDTFW